MNMSGDQQKQDSMPATGRPAPSRSADLSVWLIWATVMLVAIAMLPFAVRSQEVVRAIANLCGLTLN